MFCSQADMVSTGGPSTNVINLIAPGQRYIKIIVTNNDNFHASKEIFNPAALCPNSADRRVYDFLQITTSKC